MVDEKQTEPAPTDPRVVAMLGALFGPDWKDKLGSEVAFDRGPMDCWVYAVETMLAAADGADPLRVAILGLVQAQGAAGADGANLPRAS